MSPKAAAVTKLSRCLPDPAPPSHHSDQRGHRRFGTAGAACGAVTTAAAAADADGTVHLAQAVPTSAAVIVYAFNPADQLVKGLVAAAGTSGRPCPPAAAEGGGGDMDDHCKCVLVRAAAPVGGGSSGGGSGDGFGSGAWTSVAGGSARGESSRNGDGGGGFGSALASGLSRPVLAEEMGETHLWVVDSQGRRHLAAAFVSLQRATVFITLSASAQFPPFRVENRSSMETLAYRQVSCGCECTMIGRTFALRTFFLTSIR